MKTVKVLWSKRPARLVAHGEQQSVIEWLDTGTEQAVSTDQIKIQKVDLSYGELKEKYGIVEPKSKREGPTKQSIANDIVAAGGERVDLIQKIMDKCKMSKAGATTYYYNATKQLKG